MKKTTIRIIASGTVLCLMAVFVLTPVCYGATQTDGGSAHYSNIIMPMFPRTATSTTDARVYCSLLSTGFAPVKLDADDEDNVMRQEFIHKFLIRNTYAYAIRLDQTYMTISFKVSFNTSHITWAELIDVEWIGGQLICDRVGTSGSLYFQNSPDITETSYITVPANSTIYCIFHSTWESNTDGTSLAFNNSSVQLTSPTQANMTIYQTESHTTYESYLPDIYELLAGSYLDVITPSEEVSETSDDMSETIDDMHDTEQGWFDTSLTDVEATGLSQYTFGTTQLSGINSIKGLFTRLYNATGNWALIYTFVLTLTLAVFILRHRPRAYKKDD